MVKKRTNAPVSVATAARQKVKTQAAGELQQTADIPPEDDTQEKVDAVIKIPIGTPDEGHCPKGVNTSLTARQGAALKALLCTLQSNNAKCEMTGYSERTKSVEGYGHVVRWLLDQVADSLENELEPAKLLRDFNLVI